MKKLILVTAILLLAARIFSQEEAPLKGQDNLTGPAPRSLESEPLSQESVTIRSVTVQASGGTKESALRKNIGIKEGLSYKDRAALDDFLAAQKQKLINSRLFESSEIQVQDAGNGENGSRLVDVSVQTVDTGHFMVVPYYKYSSNDGHTIKVKLKDDNFLGLMSEFSADVFGQYEQKEGKEDDFVAGGSLQYKLPFKLGPFQASWNNDHFFKHAFIRSEPEWDLNTGFSFALPFENFSLCLDLAQGFVRNADYKVFDDELYFSEYARLSAPIVLERFKKTGNLVYTPAVELDWKWSKDGINDADEDLLSPRLIFSHSLSLGQVNWVGNFRKGFEAEIRQSAAYNFQAKMFQPGVKIQAKAFAAWKYAAINSRLTLFAERERFVRFAESLRGVPDDQYFAGFPHTPNGYAAKSAAAIILNLDFPIKLMSLYLENWGLRFLKTFNMEIQIVSFIDVALAANRSTGRVFDPRDGFYCAGVEFLMFPYKWKSVQIRASAGFDVGRLLLKDWIDTSWRDKDSSKFEITFGIGLFY